MGIICPPPLGWNRVKWSAKIWVCHGTPRDDRPVQRFKDFFTPWEKPCTKIKRDSNPRILTLKRVHTSLLSNWRSGYEKGDTQWGRDQGWTVIRAEECWHKSLGGHSTTTRTQFYQILTTYPSRIDNTHWSASPNFQQKLILFLNRWTNY